MRQHLAVGIVVFSCRLCYFPAAEAVYSTTRYERNTFRPATAHTEDATPKGMTAKRAKRDGVANPRDKSHDPTFEARHRKGPHR